METFFYDGLYVYTGENSPSRKGVSLVKGEEYYVRAIEIEKVWYAFVNGDDGYMTRHLLRDFKSRKEIRAEVIDEFLKSI